MYIGFKQHERFMPFLLKFVARTHLFITRTKTDQEKFVTYQLDGEKGFHYIHYFLQCFLLFFTPSSMSTDTNSANRLMRLGIKTSLKEYLDSVLGGNRDPLVIQKQKPWYNVDATINYELLIDKSKGERHKKSNKFKVLQELKRI